MPVLTSVIEHLKRKAAFAKRGFCRGKQVGTIFPSPKRVVRTMLDPVDWYGVRHIVELGPGDGPVTKEILRRMPYDARLTAYEIDPFFCGKLEDIEDDRLTIVNAGAENLDDSADVIISTVPMSKFSICKGRSRTLDAVVDCLSPDGQFVHHQYLPWQMGKVLRNYFDDVQCSRVFWILPVYHCREPR